MSRIGLVLHGEDGEAQDHVGRLVQRLSAGGHTVVAVVGDLSEQICTSHDLVAVSPTEFPDDLDLAISLGGDGTMLRTVGLLEGANVNILGGNFGDLGYLTVAEPEQLHEAIERSLVGDHDTEERMLVAGTLGDETVHALNDLVVERAPGETSVRLGVAIDGKPFTSYPADGLIVATPTGSTAYALSARGPIVAPTHSCLQLTPVSPHMLFDRTLILAPDTVVELTLEGHRNAVVSVDGRTMLTMAPGDTFRCTRSKRVARLITFDDRDFLAVLKSKLGLADR